MGLLPLWKRRANVDIGAPIEIASEAGAPTDIARQLSTSTNDRRTTIAGMDIDQLRVSVAACRACRLCETRTQTVFGVGVANPEWLIVGEAPGAEEDARGEPFVGQAGRLLDNMLAAAGLARARNVFITNVLKCRPPGNRNPGADEMRECEPYLRRQIELLAPRIVLALGKFAAVSLLGSDASIASLRGRVHSIAVGARSVPVVVSYHPAYLLRKPEDKAKAWADLCFARGIVATLPKMQPG